MARTIMVVDDSPTDQKLVVNALVSKGFRIVTANDGEEAIAKAATEKPNLIVMDVVMPKKNGFQVCRHLKTQAETKEIKILLVTSKNQESDRFWGMKQGADAYLTKPFADDQLVNAVNQLL